MVLFRAYIQFFQFALTPVSRLLSPIIIQRLERAYAWNNRVSTLTALFFISVFLGIFGICVFGMFLAPLVIGISSKSYLLILATIVFNCFAYKLLYSNLIMGIDMYSYSIFEILNNILPEKESRNREILHFLSAQRNRNGEERFAFFESGSFIRVRDGINNEILEKLGVQYRSGGRAPRRNNHEDRDKQEDQFIEQILQEFKNLPLFVETYFTKSSSLVRYIGERSKNSEGVVPAYFVLFLLSIPKRKEMSIDQIKAIVNCAQFCEGHPKSFFTHKDGNNLFSFLKKDQEVSQAFQSYSTEQIKNLLTKQYTGNQYTQWLSLVLLSKQVTDPSNKFISHILDNERKPLMNPKLRGIKDKKHEKYKVEVLETKRDYAQARDDFRNCVNGYFNQHSLDVITLYFENKPVLCVSYDKNLKQVEAKSPFNNTPDPSHLSYLNTLVGQIKEGS